MMSTMELDTLLEVAKILGALISGSGVTIGVNRWRNRNNNGKTPATRGDIDGLSKEILYVTAEVGELKEEVRSIHDKFDRQANVCADRGERIAILEERTRNGSI